MKGLHTIVSALIAAFLLIASWNSSDAQTLMPLPAHASVYANTYARGLWFVAPINFTITGLKVAPEAGTGLQYIHVMKCTATFPVATSGSTAFTTLSYISGAPNNVIQNVNIPVQQGDQIGILGTVTGIANSYAASAIVTTTIGGQSTYLNRFGYQGSIETGPAPNYWGSGNGTAGQIGRIYVYYTTVGRTDIGVDTLILPGDSICAGLSPVIALLRNYGPQPLANASIVWKVNNNPSSQVAWSGNLPVNGVDTVTLGNFTFNQNTLYDITAYSQNPNSQSDTANYNDTLLKEGIIVKPIPTATINTSTATICPGDSFLISGSLTGIPPWSITIDNGSTSFSINNITTSTYSVTVHPSAPTTYTINAVSDAGNCTNNTPVSVFVNTKPAPLATISPFGSTSACQGDSVLLIANSGSTLTYQWFNNNVPIPASNNYLAMAKQSGAYTVQVSDTNGCSTMSAPINVAIHPLPTVYLGKDTVLLPGNSITLKAGIGFASYLWSTGATTSQIVFDTTGIGIGVKFVWVKIVDANGCKATDTIRIHFTPNPGINELAGSPGFNLIPNPSNGQFELSLDNFPLTAIQVNVFALDGKKVHSLYRIVESKSESIQMDLTGLPEGMYILELACEEDIFVRKLIIRQ